MSNSNNLPHGIRIDGRIIAQDILNELKPQVQLLKTNDIMPMLAVILIGNNESSKSYIKQKQLKASEIGAEINLYHHEIISNNELLKLISKLNNDTKIHGIIVQRPLPNNIDRNEISNAINPSKDVDGFNPNSNYNPPVALAVIEILKSINIINLKNQKIIIIGKGETGGKPIINTLNKLNIKANVIDRNSKNPDEIISNSEIIITATGNKNVIKPELLNKSQILIGVGLYLKDGKLHGDYNESEIENRVKYYTPTIGGVGPVNVSFLMKNLVQAAL